MATQGPKNPALPASRPDFNTTRYANLARQFARGPHGQVHVRGVTDNAMAGKPTEALIEQIILTRKIERNGSR